MSGRLFGDAVYEAWRQGLNPDLVDPGRLRDDESCYGREGAIERECERIRPRREEDDWS